MFPAIGMDFLLIGGEVDTLDVLRAASEKRDIISEEERRKSACSFEICEEKDADLDSTIVKYIDNACKIGIDLREAGEVKLWIGGLSKAGRIFYKESDRDILLEQLVLMLCGGAWMDADLADIMPFLEKGCLFRWIAAGADELVEKGTALVSEAIKETKEREAEILLQICGEESIAVYAELLCEVETLEAVEVLMSQGIFAEPILGKSTIALFMPISKL